MNRGDGGAADPGQVLYEQRLTVLKGLFMPDAPPWDELPDEVKRRWRQYADESGPHRSR